MPRILNYRDGTLYQKLLPEIDALFHKEGTLSFDKPFKLVADLNKESSLNLGGFIIDIQDDCLHINREQVSIVADKVCNDVISPKLNDQCHIELYYDYHVFEIFINQGKYAMSQVVYELNDNIDLKNVEVTVYVQ